MVAAFVLRGLPGLARLVVGEIDDSFRQYLQSLTLAIYGTSEFQRATSETGPSSIALDFASTHYDCLGTLIP